MHRKSSPIWKQGNTPALSSGFWKRSRCCKANDRNWKTLQLPAMDQSWSLHKLKWNRHKKISIHFMSAGRNLKEKGGTSPG